MIALNASNLSKSLGKLNLRDVSFSVSSGQTACLLGPSGCGKTTILRMAAGLLSPDGGKVRYALEKGNEITPRELRGSIGLSLQEPALYPELSLRENAEYFASLQGIYGEAFSAQFADLCLKLELSEFAQQEAGNLSGGQKKRASIVNALIASPQIVLLDEPTAGLDYNSRRLVWELIEELENEGKLVLMTTHYLEEAEYIGEYLVIIDDGRVVAQDEPGALLSNVLGKSIVRAECRPGEHFEPEQVRSILAKAGAESVACNDSIVIAKTLKPIAAQAALEQYITNRRLKAFAVCRPPTLDDAFFVLTGRVGAEIAEKRP